jgi:hypothetical protein
MINKIKNFLKLNGWENHGYDDEGYCLFYRQDYFSFDINEKEIVFIDDRGDFLYLPVNKYTIYTLAGYLLYFEAVDKVIFPEGKK